MCVLEHDVESCMSLAPESGIADVIFVHEIDSFLHMCRVTSRYSGTEALSAITPVPLVAVLGREWLEGKMTVSTPKPTTCRPQHSM